MVIVNQPQGARGAPSSRHRQKKRSRMMIHNLIIVVFFLTKFLNCCAIFSLVAILLLLAMASYPVRSSSHVKRSHFFLENSPRLPAWSCSKKPNRRKSDVVCVRISGKDGVVGIDCTCPSLSLASSGQHFLSL